jgi:outer membrane protein TolC
MHHLLLPSLDRRVRSTAGRAMLRPLAFLAAFVASMLCTAQLTLQHCQERARTNHPLIQQYELIAKSAEYTISNANKAYLPQGSVTGIGAYILSGPPMLTAGDRARAIGIAQVDQVIWDGGTTAAQKDVVAANAEVEKANLDVSFHQVHERIEQLFFGILVTDAQLAQLEIATASLQRNLNGVKLSKDNGLVYQSDVDEVNAELLNLGQRKIEFMYARRGYVDMLSLMIGEPLDQAVVLERPAAPLTDPAAPGQRPELTVFNQQRALATAEHDQERTALMPKVGLLGAGVLIHPAIGLGASELSSMAMAGLRLSWNTGALYRSGNDRKLHELRMARIASQESVFLFNNAITLKQDDAEVEKARAVLAADEEIVALKKKIKDAYQLKYDNGLCSMNDLINAINKESEAESNKALHEVQLTLSLYRHATDNGNE